jgi:glycosyltransferase involved in cell wall biosynthesis
MLLLSQLPQDPASGAARSMRTICEFLAGAGLEVTALATTARESAAEINPLEYLRGAAADIAVERTAARPEGGGEVLRFAIKGVKYTLLNTEPHGFRDWEGPLGATFDALFSQCLNDFHPDILFTYGGSRAEMARRKLARHRGCKVVFGLRNLSYLAPGAFADVDAILTGSQFVTDRYRAALGIDSTPLPLPLDWDEVVAPQHEKVFITYVNPSIEKGVCFAARLLEELSARRPDIPILVVESRATAGLLVSAGLAGGFDLRRHANLMVGGTVPRPAAIFNVARVLLAPSVWEEPAGRVAAEALANGIPPVVSDRGGLAEVCGHGGFVLPLPADLTLATRRPVAREAVEDWLTLLLRLVDDEPFYEAACRRAAEAGRLYRPETLAPRYVDFFHQVHAQTRR